MEQPCRTYNKAIFIQWEPNEHGMPMAIYDVELPDGTHIIMDSRQLTVLRALDIYLKLNREDCRKKMKEFFLHLRGTTRYYETWQTNFSETSLQK